VEAPDRGNPHIVIDDIGERLIFSHPFYDSYGVYRGTALFSLSARAVMDRRAAEGRIKVGEDVSVISEPAGLVIGLPHGGKSAALPLVAQIWHENILSLGRLHSGLTNTGLALMSMKTTQGLYIGRLVNESILGFPQVLRIILLASFLLTVYLILFLFLNIRQDNMTVIQNRIKGLQINLIKEYYDAKGDVDWDRWRKELQQRRKELHTELKRGIGAGEDTELDTLIDKSWDELLAAIGGGAGRRADIDEEKLKALVDRYLHTKPPKERNEAPEELGEMEEVEELESPAAALRGMPKIRELDPLELEESEGGSGKVNLASTIEFSPLSEEIEKQKEAAAKSMAEKFKIQSPFPAIFSGLSGGEPQSEEPALLLEEEEEPAELLSAEEDAPIELLSVEDDAPAELLSVEEDESSELLSVEEDAPLELLSAEEDAPVELLSAEEDESAELLSPEEDESAELLSPEEDESVELLSPEEDTPRSAATGLMEDNAKPLNMYFVKPLLSVPFSAALNTEIEVLEVQDMDDDAMPEPPSRGEENTVITKRNGVPYINEGTRNPDRETIKGLDRNFKRLVESVLAKD
jgi:hypothetical protein